MAKRLGDVRTSRARNVGTFPTRPFTPALRVWIVRFGYSYRPPIPNEGRAEVALSYAPISDQVDRFTCGVWGSSWGDVPDL